MFRSRRFRHFLCSRGFGAVVFFFLGGFLASSGAIEPPKTSNGLTTVPVQLGAEIGFADDFAVLSDSTTVILRRVANRDVPSSAFEIHKDDGSTHSISTEGWVRRMRCRGPRIYAMEERWSPTAAEQRLMWELAESNKDRAALAALISMEPESSASVRVYNLEDRSSKTLLSWKGPGRPDDFVVGNDSLYLFSLALDELKTGCSMTVTTFSLLNRKTSSSAFVPLGELTLAPSGFQLDGNWLYFVYGKSAGEGLPHWMTKSMICRINLTSFALEKLLTDRNIGSFCLLTGGPRLAYLVTDIRDIRGASWAFLLKSLPLQNPSDPPLELEIHASNAQLKYDSFHNRLLVRTSLLPDNAEPSSATVSLVEVVLPANHE